MIETTCECGSAVQLPETEINTYRPCESCGATLTITTAEALAAGAGAGDFDARLVITEGPDRVGEQIILGGVMDIEVGKQEGCYILLAGKMVSRLHCRLKRVDFGPSRWAVEDNHSKNGLYVNAERVTEAVELKNGDKVQIGEYELRFSNAAPTRAAMVHAATGAGALSSGDFKANAGGPICPSCDQTIGRKAKICVRCGIHVPSGRPLLISQGLDEDNVYVQAQNVITFLSWVMPVTLMPIPLASEAFGTRKPYATWAIAALTVVVSLFFFVANWSEPAHENLMLWPKGAEDGYVFSEEDVESIKDELFSTTQVEEFEKKKAELKDTVPFHRLETEALRAVSPEVDAFLDMAPRGEQQWYQFFTHALLHDTGGIFGFIFHLGGNMLFLIVFGSRVASLVGNITMAILYPVLALAAASAHLAFAEGTSPMLGASGAVFGLAGMYLILFPAHKVFCAMWIRLGLRFGFRLAFTIFALRGFWLLLIYIGYDVLMTVLGVQSGTAHYAHIGGFVAGMVLGLAFLLSRKFNTHGGDLLSVTLGRHAWAFTGKPSQWHRAVG